MSLTLDAPLAADDPSKEIRNGLVVLGAFGAMFVGWAAVAPLDAAATATGQISVSGHDQIVQHPDGGVIAAVDVVEGQAVRARQVLVELAPETQVANVRSLKSQAISLQAQQARLTAEMDDQASIAWPQALLTAAGDDAAAARDAMKDQQRQFEAGRALLGAEQAMNRRRAAGLEEQIGLRTLEQPHGVL